MECLSRRLVSLAFVVTLLLLTGCPIDPICLLRLPPPEEELDRAVEAARSIRPGMTRAELFDALPPAVIDDVREASSEGGSRLGYLSGRRIFVLADLVDGRVPPGSWIRLSVRGPLARPVTPMEAAVQVADVPLHDESG